MVSLFPVVTVEKIHESFHPLARSEVVEELAYLVLKQDDDGYHSHAHQLVEDGTQQFHLQNLADEEP